VSNDGDKVCTFAGLLMAKELKLGSGTVGLGLREWKEIDQPRESVAVGLGREDG